jgi:hypothetical protein
MTPHKSTRVSPSVGQAGNHRIVFRANQILDRGMEVPGAAQADSEQPICALRSGGAVRAAPRDGGRAVRCALLWYSESGSPGMPFSSSQTFIASRSSASPENKSAERIVAVDWFNARTIPSRKGLCETDAAPVWHELLMMQARKRVGSPRSFG